MKSRTLAIVGAVVVLVALISVGIYIDKRNSSKSGKNSGVLADASKDNTAANKEDWKVYTNADYGFGFKYPADTKITRVSDKEIRFDFGSETLILPAIKIEQENFPENILTFNKSLTLKTDCDPKNLPTSGNSSDLTINGVNFKKVETGSVTGDVGHDLFVYRLVPESSNNRCADFQFDLSHKLDLFEMYKKNPPGDYMNLFEQTTNRGMIALDKFSRDILATMEFYDVPGTK